MLVYLGPPRSLLIQPESQWKLCPEEFEVILFKAFPDTDIIMNIFSKFNQAISSSTSVPWAWASLRASSKGTRTAQDDGLDGRIGQVPQVGGLVLTAGDFLRQGFLLCSTVIITPFHPLFKTLRGLSIVSAGEDNEASPRRSRAAFCRVRGGGATALDISAILWYNGLRVEPLYHHTKL